MTPGDRLRRDMDRENWPDDAVWHRRRLESDAAYLGFMVYLDMLPGDRSVDRAFERAGGPQDHLPLTSITQWRRCAGRHHWVERAHAFERWMQEKDIIAQEKKLEEEEAEWAKVRTKQRKETLQTGEALIAKAKAMLAFPLAEVETVTEVYENGNPRTIQIFKPGRWRFGDVARLVDVGTKLIRLAAEMDTERHRVDMRVIWDEADRLAKEHNLDREDILKVADRIVADRWGQGNSPYGQFSDDDGS